jgi:hypothetical protein
MQLDTTIVITTSAISFIMGRLFSLRNMSISDNFSNIGVGVGVATLAYKIQPLYLIAFLILGIIKIGILSTTVSLILAFVLGTIISVIFVRLKLISSITTNTAPIVMTLYGLLLIGSYIFIINYLFSL